MRRRLMWWVLFGAGVVVTALFTGEALATPAVGFVGTTVTMGRFSGIEVLNQLVPQGGNTNFWLSWQKTIGLSDVYVQFNVWDPGGDTGWHTHPGSSLIIVTTGAVTAYEGNDPTCKPSTYTTGMGFVDPGGDHVHLIRNEGTVPANTIAVQLIPAGAARRIDAANPGNCPF
jgi:hypothetical protein